MFLIFFYLFPLCFFYLFLFVAALLCIATGREFKSSLGAQDVSLICFDYLLINSLVHHRDTEHTHTHTLLLFFTHTRTHIRYTHARTLIRCACVLVLSLCFFFLLRHTHVAAALETRERDTSS